MLRRRSLGSDCCGWSGLSRFCAHTNSNASARVDRDADGDTCFDPDGLALPNCRSNANSAAPSDSCSHIGARAYPGRRAHKLDPVRILRARVRICGSPRGLPGPRRRNHQNRGQCAPGHLSRQPDRLLVCESRRPGRERCGVSSRHSIRTVSS